MAIRKRPWDTHASNFGPLKNLHCPVLDRQLSALLEDMDQRGMFKDTLLVVTGEFGRSPTVGREHFGQYQLTRRPRPLALLLYGAGGGSGNQARRHVRQVGRKGLVAEREFPVHPTDLLATIYYALGIDPANGAQRSGTAARIGEGNAPGETVQLGCRPSRSSPVCVFRRVVVSKNSGGGSSKSDFFARSATCTNLHSAD